MNNNNNKTLCTIRITKLPLIAACSLVLLLPVTSCKKLVNVDAPGNQIAGSNVFDNDATAIAVMNGLYIQLAQVGFGGGNLGIAYRAGLSADELTLWPDSFDETLRGYYKNALVSTNSTPWPDLYNFLLTTNKVIESVSNAPNLTPAVSQQLLGEALFMRAFFHFYLLNLYGEVPIILTTDYNVNRLAARQPTETVYNQIKDDLTQALNLLGDEYLGADLLHPVDERVRPTKWAAAAFLARVYLFTKQWQKAEEMATAVIEKTTLFSLPSLSEVFLSDSKEAIWQIQPVDPNRNTMEAPNFIISNGPNFMTSAYLSPSLIDAFEPADQRWNEWVGKDTLSGPTYYYPLKYKKTSGLPWTEYLTIFRLAEQYLIRAEARAEDGNLEEAKADLDEIRARAALSPSTATTKDQILRAILHERQVELFTEWGHRWLDIKRTGNVDQIMTAVSVDKQTTWDTKWQLYPIPLSELQRDPNLQQNPGY